MAAGALLSLASLVAGPGGAATGSGLLLTVGEVDQRSAVIWVRAPGPGRIAAELRAAGNPPTVRAAAAEAREDEDFTVKLVFDALSPATRHAYRVRWGGQQEDGEFVTAPPPSAPEPVRLVWSGDLGGGGRCRSPDLGYPIFRAMAARRPDVFVFVGDTIYADQRCRVPENVPGADFIARDLAGFRAKHRYNRSDPAFQAFLRSTSAYTIWDDHEVVNDFAGSVEPLMPIGRRALLEYWPIRPPAEEPTRLYRRVRWGRLLELFILDTRQYRSPNAMPDGPGKTMLGAAQREWLLAGLSGSDAVWKVIVSSVSLSIPTGRAGRDGWAAGVARGRGEVPRTGFAHELAIVVQALAAQRARNVVWLVADVHRAEVIRHGPAPGLVFHELVAGPLSASLGVPGPLDPALNPSRLYAEGGFDNFGELLATPAGLEVRIITATGQVRFETVLLPEP